MMTKNTLRLQNIVFFILEKNERSEVAISLQIQAGNLPLLFMQLDSILLTTSIFESLPLL